MGRKSPSSADIASIGNPVMFDTLARSVGLVAYVCIVESVLMAKLSTTRSFTSALVRLFAADPWRITFATNVATTFGMLLSSAPLKAAPENVSTDSEMMQLTEISLK